MRSSEIIGILAQGGWYQVRQTAGHKHFRHPDKAGTVTLPPLHNEVGPGLVASVQRLCSASHC
ncbi:type II toxin-antitoxin system HicA family toxin [Sphingomonas crocodyli]